MPEQSDVEIMVVILPGGPSWRPDGLMVCDFQMLVSNVLDGLSVDDAAGQAAIEDLDPDDTALIARIRRLNADGDITAYWDRSRSDRA